MAPTPSPHRNPRYGLLSSYVATAAVKAPASIRPSRAILITPERSENIPPKAAKISGVAPRIAEKSKMSKNEGVNNSLILFPRVSLQRGYKNNDDRLEDLDKVF